MIPMKQMKLTPKLGTTRPSESKKAAVKVRLPMNKTVSRFWPAYKVPRKSIFYFRTTTLAPQPPPKTGVTGVSIEEVPAQTLEALAVAKRGLQDSSSGNQGPQKKKPKIAHNVNWATRYSLHDMSYA